MAERARGASKQMGDHLGKRRRAHAHTAQPLVSESRRIYLHKRQINVGLCAVSFSPFPLSVSRSSLRTVVEFKSRQTPSVGELWHFQSHKLLIMDNFCFFCFFDEMPADSAQSFRNQVMIRILRVGGGGVFAIRPFKVLLRWLSETLRGPGESAQEGKRVAGRAATQTCAWWLPSNSCGHWPLTQSPTAWWFFWLTKWQWLSP